MPFYSEEYDPLSHNLSPTPIMDMCIFVQILKKTNFRSMNFHCGNRKEQLINLIEKEYEDCYSYLVKNVNNYCFAMNNYSDFPLCFGK